jgi:hypothetical protein
VEKNQKQKCLLLLQRDSLLADIRNESVDINEMPYQVMGSPDGGKEKKIGKPVRSKKYADARASELADTHKSTGGKYRSQYVEEIEIDEDAGIVSGLAGLALGAKGASYAAKHSKRMRDYPKNFVKGIVDPRTYVSKKKKEQKEEFQIDEKALSKQQQKFMGMVYAVKKGEMKAPSAAVAKAAAGMTKKQAKDFAKTKHKGLPQVKEDVLNEREHDEPGEGTRQKYGDMRGIDRSGPETSFGGKLQSKERKAAALAALAKNKKVQEQMDEPMEPAVDKQAEMQKKKIQMQKVRELTTRLQSARKGVY